MDSTEFEAMLVHGRLAELHKIAMEYNQRKGNKYLVAWHKLCIKAELYMAREHFKAIRREK